MTSDFLIQPFSQEASAFLASLNQDMQRQEAMEHGKPFAHHACSLDMQICVHRMSAAQRVALLDELKVVFYRYVAEQSNKSLSRVALNYFNMLAYGSLNASGQGHCLVPHMARELENAAQGVDDRLALSAS